MSKRVRQTWDGKPVPPELWGKDHRSTLLYVESRCVDYSGKLDRRHLRLDGGELDKQHLRLDVEHPTRLATGFDLIGHDDLDCVADFEAAGLVDNIGTGLHPLVSLTDAGWKAAWELRRERARATSDRKLNR